MRRLVGSLIVVAALAAGCAAPPPTPGPAEPSATPGAAVPSSPPPTDSATASAPPSPTSAASPTAGGGSLRWSAPVATPHLSITALTATGAGFIAFGRDPGAASGALRLYSSADGSAWTPVAPSPSAVFAPAAGRQILVFGVAADGRQVVAVGTDESAEGNSGSAAAWVSSDGGVTWARADLPRPSDAELFAAAHGPSGWVAVGSDGFAAANTQVQTLGGLAAWTSHDGRVWTRAAESPALSGGFARHVTRVTGGFVASGTAVNGAASPVARWSSATGSTWAALPSPSLLDADEEASGEAAVVVGTGADRTPGIWQSAGGAPLAPADAPVMPAGTRMAGVASDGRCWLAVGTDTSSSPPQTTAWSFTGTGPWTVSATLPATGGGLVAAAQGTFLVTSDLEQADGSFVPQVQTATCQGG